MALERFLDLPDTPFWVEGPSKETDIYSLAMTSFSVCASLKTTLPLDTWPCYDQVLTGVSPYHGSDKNDMITRICADERPSRPVDSGLGQLSQDPVWDVITAGWHHQPKQRCELSAMSHAFPPLSQQDVQNVKPGDLNIQHEGNLTTAKVFQKPKQDNLGRSSHGSPLSSGFCRTLSQKYRDALTK